jgi:hypothetical protein
LLRTQIEFVRWQIKQAASLPEKRLKWTSGIVDLVELVYALHEAGCFNQGNIYLKDLFVEMGNIFGMEIKNFSLYFTSIKNRVKGDRTKFLDKLKHTLVNRMESDDRRY